MAVKFWADEEVLTLRKMHAQGKSNKEIAKQLGVTTKRVIYKKNRLQKDGKLAYKEAKIDTISGIVKAAKEAGLSYGEYVKQYGV